MSEAETTVTVRLDGLEEALARVADLGRAIRDLNGRPSPYQAGVRRFETLCVDLFKVRARERPELDAARILVIGVEGGDVGRRQIGKIAAERFPHLSETERAFAVGFAMGFMTEFLPREG